MILSDDPPDVMNAGGWSWNCIGIGSGPRWVLGPCLICVGQARTLGHPFLAELLMAALT